MTFSNLSEQETDCPEGTYCGANSTLPETLSSDEGRHVASGGGVGQEECEAGHRGAKVCSVCPATPLGNYLNPLHGKKRGSFVKARSKLTPALKITLVAPPKSPENKITGFITKKGRIWPSWKTRYFVLEQSVFRYYTDKSRYDMRGKGTCHSVERWPEKRNGLILKCRNGRKFFLICHSDKECNKWWRAFSRAIDAALMGE